LRVVSRVRHQHKQNTHVVSVNVFELCSSAILFKIINKLCNNMI
jgi:hypothetical protein